MLKQRIITAVVLLLVLGAAMLAPSSWPLLLILLLASSLASWEWLRLALPASQRALAPYLAVVLAALLLWLSYASFSATPSSESQAILQLIYVYISPLVILFWLLYVPHLIRQAQVQQIQQSVVLSAMGILAPLVTWAALVQMWLSRGLLYVLSVLVLIWVADITAYFVGRAFGKAKLAPRVSPGKTWAGALGGVLGACLWVALSTIWPNTLGTVLYQQWSAVGMVLIAAVLAALSIMGDLFESLLKRRAGVKDSSQLLPGHGGVYDRIDALLPVAPLAMLLGGQVGL